METYNEALGNLKNTTTPEFQLQEELNSNWQKVCSSTTDTMKLLCDFIASINVDINEDKMMEMYLNGLLQ